MKRYLSDHSPTTSFSLWSWRIILRINIAINRWSIWLYRYQMAHSGPSVILTDLIADLEGDLVRFELELRYL